jgi:hypothetical protein
MKKIKCILILIIFVLITSCATQNKIAKHSYNKHKTIKCSYDKHKVPFTVWIVFIGQVK